MNVYGDVGEEVVGRLAARLGGAPHDLTLWQRGLTWHPAGLTQHVWAETSGPGAIGTAWRVHVRTWCLKRVVASSEQTSALATAMADFTMSALIRKPGSPSRLGLGASILLADGYVDWTSRVMASVARLQLHDAIRLTRSVAVKEAGAAPDLATDRLGPPTSLVASVPDAIDPALLPSVAMDALPFAEVAAALRLHDGVRAIATHTGVIASFPWKSDAERHDFIVLEIRPAVRKSLGAGVTIAMSLPLPTPSALLHALALNEAEMQAGSPTDLLGGWLVRHTSLMHESFVPWSLCNGEFIRHLAESAARRAAWLRLSGRTIVPADWPSDAPGRVLPFKRLS